MEAREQVLITEGSDGRKRITTYDIGSRLVRNSQIIDDSLLPPSPHLDGLTLSQAKGLGLEFLLKPTD